MPEENDTPAPGQTREELPEWARKQISDANQEAAKYRVQVREKDTALQAALEENATLKNTAGTDKTAKEAAELNLLRINVALKAGIPGENAAAFAARLQGSTEDEIKSDAEALMNAFGSDAFTGAPHAATDPSQGRGSENNNATRSPEVAMAAFLKDAFEQRLR